MIGSLTFQGLTKSLKSFTYFGVLKHLGGVRLQTYIHTDKGVCVILYIYFITQLNDVIFTAFGVKGMICSAYHPESNGQDERTNQTLKRALSRYTNDAQSDWNK